MGILIFYLLHGLLVFGVGRRLLKSARPEERGVLVWMGGVSLFLPVLAELLFAGGRLLTPKTARVVPSVAEEPAILEEAAEDGLLHEIKEIRAMASEDYRLMPLIDELEGEDNEHKKELIIGLLDKRVSRKGKYLHAALEHDDPEVVHYAATTLNVLKDQYADRIQEASGLTESGGREAFKELDRLYRDYLASGLLNKDMQSLVRKDYVTFLKKAREHYPETALYYEQLGSQYLELGQLGEARAVFLEACSRFPSFQGGYVGMLRTAYEGLDWKTVRHYLGLIDKHIPAEQIPEPWSPVIRQLKGVCGIQ
ncbi:hypothetical protein MJA45_25575 [Paenibacillus aurantius]|uniref:Tetratricopeptide repeat protein n=1 Tax=Paenibacillus aurantius TaxID=2918900 RepID=A0AA96REZ4_9BACL|nr:hypothetical protein [Paenibacillus aurantius]WNQ10946.1 hypothetical protein MJA45_25575 [Paenibacillus aurantius]